jgi:putative ABC transport system substrate-binding protein
VERRAFMTLLGGAVAAWPIATRAQQRDKLPAIGFLGTNTFSAQRRWTAAFVRRLEELGWIEGRTIAIEYRWAEGRTERFADLATELVRSQVDVIVTLGAAVAAAQKATSKIPIVFAVALDPVASGLVASLARPGGNVTGLSLQQSEIAGKRLQFLREVIPNLGRLGIIANVANPTNRLEVGEVQAAAHAAGVDASIFEIRRPADIAPVFDTLKNRAEALYVVNEPLAVTERIHINKLALSARLPTVHGSREQAEAGGLIAYAANFPDLFRRAAEYVDKILRGTKPSDIPVEQPTKFDLVINLTTAKTLGLDIPPTLLTRADEVIE